MSKARRDMKRHVVGLLGAVALMIPACSSDSGGSKDSAAPTTAASADEPSSTTGATTAATDATGDTTAAPDTAEATGETTAVTDEGSATTDDVATTTPAPEDIDPEGVLRIGYDMIQQGGEGIELDPAVSKTSTNEALLYFIYGRLMRPTSDGSLVPDLAESATVVDPNTIDIVVRSGVTFQDGSPFDAAAVKVGLERNLGSGSPEAYGDAFFSLSSVEVTDPQTVRLTFSDGTAPSWYDTYLGAWETTIVKPDTDFSHPVGAGPFMLTDYQPEQSMVLTKYADYWDADSILVGGMELLHIASDQPQSGIAALRAGQIDSVLTDASQLPGLSGEIAPLIKPQANQTVSLLLCKRDGPLSDANFRKAVNKAIDRQAISDAVYQGTGAPATQLWPAGNRFNSPDLEDALAYDPDAARELLAQSAFADDPTFDLYVVPALGLPDVAQIIQQELADIGVTMNIVQSANFVEDFLVPQAPGAGLIPGNSVSRERLTQFSGDSLGNACGYDDPGLNDLLSQLAEVSDASDEAVDLWHQINEKIVDDALAGFVMFRSGLAAYNTDRIGAIDVWPTSNFLVPDPRATYVRAG